MSIFAPETTPLKNYSYVDDYIRPQDLNIDDTYQRSIMPEKVNKIAANFNEQLAGLLYVSQRTDNTLWVCDGQHRLIAMQRRSIEFAACRIFMNLTLEQEAEIFVICNTARANPNRLSVYKASLVAGDALAQAIYNTTKDAGYTVQFTNGGNRATPHSLWAVNALYDIYNRGAGGESASISQDGLAHLSFVLTLVHECWPDDPEAVKHDVLLGFSAFWRKYHDRLDREYFIQKLREANPYVLRSRAVYHKTVGGLGSTNAMVRTIQEIYDRHRRGSYRLEARQE